jgi:hypothetical protein
MGGALVLSALVAQPAVAMSVAEFLARARALQAQGVLATLSPDLDLLRGEVRGIVRSYRADLASAKAGGREPHSCPPGGGIPRLSPDQMLRELERIPPSQRRMSMKAAFYAYMKRHYPCR